MTHAPRRLTGFARYAWATLAYTVAVVLWGAFVRATHSGAGCGAHWPQCNGQVLPTLESTEVLIEFTHRVTSGVALLLAIGLFVGAMRTAPKGHFVRRAGAWSLVLMLVEAAIGAGLVLLELVGADDSGWRAFMMALHLANTFLLLGAITLAAWSASGGAAPRLRGQGAVAAALGVALLATILVGATGAVTALGDTLFPKSSVGLDLASDPSATRHFLERLRWIHPVLAIATAVYVALAAMWLRLRVPAAPVPVLAQALVVSFFVQLFLGAANVALRAPVWMQIVHLLVADAVWIVLVLAAAAALSRQRAGIPQEPARARPPVPASSPP